MLANTDGNGDHWLDDGARVTADASGTIQVRWSTTGEGGSVPHSLDVPTCR